MRSALYLGDNLEVLRGLPAGSVNLIYLDPPFNTGRDWHTKSGELAFTDKWRWGEDAAALFKELTAEGSVQGPVLEWFRDIHGESGTLAYLLHLAARFGELHRVLAPGGGLFLHVDNMNHYLKILLDHVFGPECFAGQVIWKRTSAHNNARGFARVHDTILVFRRGGSPAAWCGADGRMLTGGHGDVWLDIRPVNAQGRERTGYPTQKPLPLLARIISLASAPGDMVLDPNCGAGTALVAAQQAGRRWTGIDLSPVAVTVTQERLGDLAADFDVHGADPAPPPGGALF